MTYPSFRYKLVRWLLLAQREHQKGFTLTELLIAIVVSTIIIGSLLFLAVELLGVNTREEKLTQTQQDMNRALDYINSDVSESVFVYADPTTIASQINDGPTGTGVTPVLAFWRFDPVDMSQVPSDCSDSSFSAAQQSECEALKVRQNTYTLVVYYQQPNSGDDIWEGETRIIRYELPKYTPSGLSTLTYRDGYVDPTLSSFAGWQADGNDTAGNKAVLVDYVDAQNNNSNEEAGDCPDSTNYTVAPTTSDNFYVCVRTGTVTDSDDANITASGNQSLVVYLRGNARKEDSQILFGPTSQASVLPTLESEILIRGVIEKNPDVN
jgi:prepilin-type N-terminal cleavage/methylation domain-containing protein